MRTRIATSRCSSETPADFSDNRERLADLETDILYDTGAVINAQPFRAGSYRDRTGFMHELRRDGLEL
jgi:hypothetical protein